jgi:hypothetical protein
VLHFPNFILVCGHDYSLIFSRIGRAPKFPALRLAPIGQRTITLGKSAEQC